MEVHLGSLAVDQHTEFEQTGVSRYGFAEDAVTSGY